MTSYRKKLLPLVLSPLMVPMVAWADGPATLVISPTESSSTPIINSITPQFATDCSYGFNRSVPSTDPCDVQSNGTTDDMHKYELILYAPLGFDGVAYSGSSTPQGFPDSTANYGDETTYSTLGSGFINVLTEFNLPSYRIDLGSFTSYFMHWVPVTDLDGGLNDGSQEHAYVPTGQYHLVEAQMWTTNTNTPTPAIAACAQGYLQCLASGYVLTQATFSYFPTIFVSSISLPGAQSLVVGSTTTLVVNVTPTEANDQVIVWSSTASSIVAVDGTGVITAVAAGNASIVATAHDGSGSAATTSITVLNPVPPVIESSTTPSTSLPASSSGGGSIIAATNGAVIEDSFGSNLSSAVPLAIMSTPSAPQNTHALQAQTAPVRIAEPVLVALQSNPQRDQLAAVATASGAVLIAWWFWVVPGSLLLGVLSGWGYAKRYA